MATVDRESSFNLVASKPGSIQPGGGFCVRLEIGWGRWRRAYLRRFRPAYVRRMLERRQGSCTDCCHDVIDARDLKHCRNVCGYWFAAEDDRFRWRERIPLARAGLAEVICFSLLFGLLAFIAGLASIYLHPAFLLLFVVALSGWLFAISFFRDPERAITSDTHALVSPADGTVTHIGEVEEADFPDGRAFRISIFLSVFNVHVNRVPRSGRVVDVRYFAGCFLDARHQECAIRNEQLWLDLEENSTARLIRVKQISGAIARRIVCWLKPGDEVKTGERFGMIKFGSRTEVLFAASEEFDLQTKVGDKVKGGSSVLLRFRKPPA